MCPDIRQSMQQTIPSSPPIALVAEDDPEMRFLLVAALRKSGFVVVQARDGAEALRRIEPLLHEADAPLRPHLVVADVRMPRFSGLEVLEAVRIIAPRLPVVLITAFGDGVHEEALRLQASAVFEKPFPIPALIDVALCLSGGTSSYMQ